MLCAMTCTRSAPQLVANSTRKSVIGRSPASMLASPPEGVAGLAQAMRLGHEHLDAAQGDAVVPLAGEAEARVRLAVGAEPHWVDHALGTSRRAALLDPDRLQTGGAGADRAGQSQLVHQFADAVLHRGEIGRLDGHALQDRLFERRGANTIAGADGGFELDEEFGERRLGGCGVGMMMKGSVY
jgi:hypothetical protein